MSKPILYQMRLSPAVRAVKMIIREAGIDLEYRDIDMMKGEHTSEWFLKMNPQHTVPTLEDNGRYIWDSHAIGVYLIEKYCKDSPLYPNDPYIRARINQRLHFESGVLTAKATAMLAPVYRAGATAIDPKSIVGVHEAYEMTNTFLKDDPYLVGNHLTLADFSCVAMISCMDEFAPIDAEKYPKLADWFKRMSQLPYYNELNGEPSKEHGVAFRYLMAKNKGA